MAFFFKSRMKGHPYWPAKVIGLSTVGNDKIDVRFFGKHEMWIVSVTDCILYSDDPNKKLDDQVRSEIDAGIKVIKFNPKIALKSKKRNPKFQP